MPSEGIPTAGGTPPREALIDALAELRDDFTPQPDESADRYWLRVGLALGLRRPGRAQLLLERLEGGAVAATTAGTGDDTPAADLESATTAVDDAATDATIVDEVPVRSMLLVRAAALPLTEPPETAFGWALGLRPDEITLMGRILDGLVAGGASPDLGRGFGLAWTGGVKLSRTELDGLFGRFTELELALASVLAGHDIREGAGATRPGLSGMVQSWFMPKSVPGAYEAGRLLERMGGPAQRGLIAVWNTWAAVRYRPLMPAALHEELIRAWVTVVGRLPEG